MRCPWTPVPGLALCCFLLLAGDSPSGRSGALLFYDGFEHAGLRGWALAINDADDPLRRTRPEHLAALYQVGRVNSPARSGKYSVRFEVRRKLGSYRSELKLPAEPRLNERWYGFSIFVPEDWGEDPAGDIVAQWHGLKDPGMMRAYPPLALHITGNRWQLAVNWDAGKRKTKEEARKAARRARLELGPLQRGVWTDWVLHVRWSYRDDGLLEVWKNGRRVVDRTGPNCYNDRRGPYFKIGIYHPSWKRKNAAAFHSQQVIVPRKVIYHDEIRIGGESATYATVAPQPPNSRLARQAGQTARNAAGGRNHVHWQPPTR